MKGGILVSVSTSVRMALAKGNKRQVELAELLGFTRQAVNLKLAKERWTGAELARVADFTGGKPRDVQNRRGEDTEKSRRGPGKESEKTSRNPKGKTAGDERGTALFLWIRQGQKHGRGAVFLM